jgi:uncharacterized RDD family membrane protein YckC
MTTPEPHGEPTPPSFEKPSTGGSPYENPYVDNPYTDNPYADDTHGSNLHGAAPVASPLPYDNPTADPSGAVHPPMPPLGGLGERLLARIIDWLLMLVPGFLLGSAIVLGSSIGNRYLVIVANAVAALLGFVYEGLMLSTRGGQTVGKKVMRIRVAVLADGSSPVGAPAWIRAAVFWLPNTLASLCLPSLFSLLDILWCTWDRPYRQCLHDKAAKTVVVRAG